MHRFVVVLAGVASLIALGSSAPPPPVSSSARDQIQAAPAHAMTDAAGLRSAIELLPPPPPPPPPPPTAEEALEDGVLIVVSLASQMTYVFKDGEVWDSSAVSTGKEGNETPVGSFPILQKKLHHRSNLYDDAPMSYMQRLTWDGVALHAGRVPGYPASHGCIRLPREFAKALYEITNFRSTVVLVTDEPLESDEDARAQV